MENKKLSCFVEKMGYRLKILWYRYNKHIYNYSLYIIIYFRVNLLLLSDC